MAKPLLSLEDVQVRRGMSTVLDRCAVESHRDKRLCLREPTGPGNQR